MSEDLNLFSSLNRVEVPFVKVTIGNYTFGVYSQEATSSMRQYVGTAMNIRFPNYIRQLRIIKINGQVNQYTLTMVYQITPDSDPNFFEKVFSSVRDSRKIVFSYGDVSMPNFIYKNEEAIITKVSSRFEASAARITYTVEAISSASLLAAKKATFPARRAQPSSVIYELLRNNARYGLLDIFYGMRNLSQVEQNSLIARDDKIVDISMKTNISILDYVTYLVSCMTPVSDSKDSLVKTGLYVLNVVDDTGSTFGGPYFTVKKLSKANSFSDRGLGTYQIDIGYPSQNVVTSFDVENNENYSILYNYSTKLTDEQYVRRINDKGELEEVYAPLLSSGNALHKTTEADRSWWTSVTAYPIKVSIGLKGLLRPALLMSYVKLNLYYFGKKHINSGTYVITQQVDEIGLDSNGFRTTLSMVRIAGDDDLIEEMSGSSSTSGSTKGGVAGASSPVVMASSKKTVR